MRAKRPYIVLSFHATVEAMAWEKHSTGALGRVRPCVADAAGGLAAVAVKA